MKKLLKSIGWSLWVLAIYLIVGIPLGLIFWYCRKKGLLRIINWERFPRYQRKLLVASTHPSILDIFLVPMLFSPSYLWNPFRYGPRVVTDANNFGNSIWFLWAKPFMVSVTRGILKRSAREALQEVIQWMVEFLRNGGILIIFPGGGRDHKGKKELTENGVLLRAFSNTLGKLIVEVPGLKVLPLYIDKGSAEALPNEDGRLVALWRLRLRRITIVIGEILEFSDQERAQPHAARDTTKVVFNAIGRCAKAA